MAKKRTTKTTESPELEKLRAELAAMTETAKRTLADFQNFKRRTEEERGELQIYANKRLLEAIFPALDNFARAFAQIPEELKGNEWVKGLDSIESNLVRALENLGLQSIEETGVPVNPHEHEVVMEAEGASGQVLQIFEKGYRFNGKTIRPAKVQVGRAQ